MINNISLKEIGKKLKQGSVIREHIKTRKEFDKATLPPFHDWTVISVQTSFVTVERSYTGRNEKCTSSIMLSDIINDKDTYQVLKSA